MKKLVRQGMRGSFLLVLILGIAVAVNAGENRYVVTLAPNAAADAESLAATYGGKVLRVIDEITIEVEVPASRAKLLSRDVRVLGMRAANFRVATSSWTTATSYTYDGAGNVTEIGSDTFAYDDVDRVVTATVSGVTETFTYDAFGNRTSCTNVTAGNSDCQAMTIVSGTNRINGLSYDAMGNLLQGGLYVYDSVGMLKQDTATSTTREYLYTADDERVAVIVGGSSWTWTLRDLSGKVLREYTSTSSSGNHTNWTWTRDNVYRNGQMLSSLQPGTNGPTTWHYHLDHLGTPRVVSNTSGTILGVHEYKAFGTEISGNAPEDPLSPSRMKYTGHERDTFNNPSNPLDYMHARYYSANWGRFLSVDPAMDLEKIMPEPQLWNRYAYVGNNPINYSDPDGRERLQRYHFNNVPVNREPASVWRMPLFVGGMLFGGPLLRAGWQMAVGLVLGNPQAAYQGADAVLSPQGSSTLPISSAEDIGRQLLDTTAEKVAGFGIFGIKRMDGSTLTREILEISADAKGRASIGGLFKAMEGEAMQAGASQLRIVGHAIINKKLLNPAIAKKFGYTYRQVDADTVELIKDLN